MPGTCDIAVIGGGPAGALAARMLAFAVPQAHIILLEARQAPAPKPCGEFLGPAGCAALARAGLLATVATHGHRLQRLNLHAARETLASDLPGTALGIRRERLDGLLLTAAADAGVTVEQGASVLGMHADIEGWHLRLRERTLNARLVLGADGRHSRIRAWTGLGACAVTGRHALSVRATGFHPSRAGEMHLGPLGQIGVCPLSDEEANLNLLLPPSHAPLLRCLPPWRLMRAAIAATPSLAGRHGTLTATTHVLAVAQLRQLATAAAGPRVALLGDAAICGDPFTGEGMSQALLDAELIAHHLTGWEPRDDPAPRLAAYATAHHRRHRRHRLETRCLPWLLDRPALAETALALLARTGLGDGLIAARHAA